MTQREKFIEILAKVLQKDQADEFGNKTIPQIIEYILSPDDKDAIETVLQAMQQAADARDEQLKPYLRHLDECNTMKDWSELDQALADTPMKYRDMDFYKEVERASEIRNVCTCGLDKILGG